jgi:hypothetical protein
MRRFRILALALFLTACSPGVDKSPSSIPVPVNPTPAGPGRVVVIAGSDTGAWYSSDGQYAVHTRLPSLGGVAAGPDGSIYFAAEIHQSGRILRVTPDGRLHLLKPDGLADGSRDAPQLAVRGKTLWYMGKSPIDGVELLRISLPEGRSARYFSSEEIARNPRITDSAGVSLPQNELKRLKPSWSSSAFGLRWDGVPIVVHESGQLFEALGGGKLRRWDPPGYSQALRDAIEPEPFNDTLHPSKIIVDRHGGLTVVGGVGIIRIHRHGPAKGFRYHRSSNGKEIVYQPGDATTLPDGSVLLISGPDSRGISTMAEAAPDGTLRKVLWENGRSCATTTTNITPDAIARRPDGNYVAPDLSCGRVYAFRMPNPIRTKPL